MDFIYVLGGLIGLFFGGEALVRGSSGLARRMALSPLLIGLTVVGFGTSTPELLISVNAAPSGAPDIALGNVLGSNIANILLIIGLTALIWPINAPTGTVRRDTGVMIAAAVILLPLFAMVQVGHLAGLGLVAGLVCYLAWAYLAPGTDACPDAAPAPVMRVLPAALWIVGGLILLLTGAHFLVEGSVAIARSHGLSEAFIGLSIVAVGTSLPELATSIIAAFRRQSEIAIGNVIGSNIFNILGILGVTAIITPIPVAGRFLSFDLPAVIAASALLAVLLLTRPMIGRAVGAGLLLAYAAYIIAAQA
ncbi:calcium/sodium antiporter [Roseovarius dicentrarchi]|uniref:calcium/sodium antiporter n=1 Tax=Roseovarius dicentrarchi TaxID=2250573 RepID=UPI000DEBBEEE|nr:calcium/sodium antiporter [Roseovarius dicentrarchi]